jgi:hypothetical protein
MKHYQAALCCLVLACGQESHPHKTTPAILAGDPSAPAAPALTNVLSSAVSPADVANGFLLTRVTLAIGASTTIGQLDAAAAAAGATAIAWSAKGSLLLGLEVPRQDDPGALRQLAVELRAQPGIRFAWPSRQPAALVLPEKSPGVAVDPHDLSQLLATRFPQAWNARKAAPDDCLPRVVDVYQWDTFGSSAVRPSFLNQIPPSNFIEDPDPVAATSSGHGYDVASVLAAAFDAEIPTGANPFEDCVSIHQIDALNRDMSDTIQRALRLLAAETAPRFLLTISLASSLALCGPKGQDECTADNLPLTSADLLRDALIERAFEAGEWAAGVASLGLGQKMVATAGAGNIDLPPFGALARSYAGFRDGRLAGPWAMATQLASVDAILGDPALWKPSDPTLPDATLTSADLDLVSEGLLDRGAPGGGIPADNLIIVGSVTNADTIDAVAESDFDFGHSDVKAVGEGIVIPDRDPLAPLKGTSFSTPEIAGLASYLWVLSDALRAQPPAATASLIKRSARSNALVSAVADAYAATLALDSPASRSIRLALLDVNGDGNFDHLDLQKWHDALHLGDPGFGGIPASRDYSRFDLNGDGTTGGIPIGAFDLDLTGSLSGAATQQIEGYPVDMTKAALTDLQILCFYAYSDLYAQAPANHDDAIAQRSSILGPDNCVGARLVASLPARITSATPFTITATTGGTPGTPAPNMLLQLTPACATVDPASGRTDANGRFTTTVTPGVGCSTVSVTAKASGDPDAPVLATQVFNGSTGTILSEWDFSVTSHAFLNVTGGVALDDEFKDSDNSRPDATGTLLVGVPSGSVPLPDGTTYTFGVKGQASGPTTTLDSGTMSGTGHCEQAGNISIGQGQVRGEYSFNLSFGSRTTGFTLVLVVHGQGSGRDAHSVNTFGGVAEINTISAGVDGPPISVTFNGTDTIDTGFTGHIDPPGGVSMSFNGDALCQLPGAVDVSGTVSWTATPD